MISWGCTSFSLISFALLFKTRLLARNLPPRIREKDPICFAICPMAGSFHSISDSSDDLDELYGNSFGSCISFSLISKSSSGLVGNHRVIKPSGHETKPATIEMPQSRPLIRLTLKAAPPTKMIKTWHPISIKMMQMNHKFLCKLWKIFQCRSSRRELTWLKS